MDPFYSLDFYRNIQKTPKKKNPKAFTHTYTHTHIDHSLDFYCNVQKNPKNPIIIQLGIWAKVSEFVNTAGKMPQKYLLLIASMVDGIAPKGPTVKYYKITT